MLRVFDKRGKSSPTLAWAAMMRRIGYLTWTNELRAEPPRGDELLLHASVSPFPGFPRQLPVTICDYPPRPELPSPTDPRNLTLLSSWKRKKLRRNGRSTSACARWVLAHRGCLGVAACQGECTRGGQRQGRTNSCRLGRSGQGNSLVAATPTSPGRATPRDCVGATLFAMRRWSPKAKP